MKNEITNTGISYKVICVYTKFSGESRKQFDVFFRKLLDGNNAAYPKPKSFKLTKNQLFQDKDTVFDYVYDKRNNGSWIPWVELEKEVPIPVNAKVG